MYLCYEYLRIDESNSYSIPSGSNSGRRVTNNGCALLHQSVRKLWRRQREREEADVGNRGRIDNLSTKLTRRKFLKAVGAGAAWITLTSSLGCAPAGRTSRTKRSTNTPPEQTNHPQTTQPKELWTFRSRPDFKPPVIDVIAPAHQQSAAPGYIFVAPKNGPDEQSPAQDGAMILDNSGEIVWFKPLQREEQDVMDFKVQRYRGEDVLTYWEGTHGGYGQGEYVILDSSYKEVGRVKAGNGYRGDHHEFLISPQDTALVTIYGKVEGFDLTEIGGPKEGRVLDGIAQEVDIHSGEVLFEWHSLEHVSLDEVYSGPPEDFRSYYDYFHINSIEVDHDNNLLISSRKTSTVYKVDRSSGEVIWRLGGNKSDFEMGEGVRFAYQHDARRQPNGTITIFDNGAWMVDDQSYGLELELDEDEMSATLVHEYPHPNGEYSGTQGSTQVLPNTNVFIGWGSNPHFSEFSRDGELLFDASFPPQVESYRAFRFEWSANPTQQELALAAERVSGGDEVRLYASWNGATQVAGWRALAGSDPGRLKPVGGSAKRDGFETTISVNTSEPYVGVRAEDSSGKVLGSSKPVKLGNQ